MKRAMNSLRAWLIEYAYLVTIAAVLAVVAGSAIYTKSLKQQQGVLAAAGAPETQATPEPTAAPVVTPLPTIAPLTVRPAALISARSAWPVEGAVLRGFDAQTPVFWETLGSWRMHTALDIAGEAGQRVAACMAGEVTDCTRDALWGWRVTVEQEDGHTVAYAGLEGSLVAEGERVACGQTLGTLLARIPCEGEMAAHLHLESVRGGIAQDPEAMLPQR